MRQRENFHSKMFLRIDPFIFSWANIFSSSSPLFVEHLATQLWYCVSTNGEFFIPQIIINISFFTSFMWKQPFSFIHLFQYFFFRNSGCSTSFFSLHILFSIFFSFIFNFSIFFISWKLNFFQYAFSQMKSIQQ